MSLAKKQIKQIAEHNGLAYNKAKAIEEMGELITALTQSTTKDSDNTEHVIEEFGDVLYRLSILKTHYNNEAIQKRKAKKLSKSVVYLQTNRFKHV